MRSDAKEELDRLWDKATELISHVNTLLESIGDLFQQDEYDAAIKIFGIHFKADFITAISQVSKARFGSVMSLIDMSKMSPEDFNAEQDSRRKEFRK